MIILGTGVQLFLKEDIGNIFIISQEGNVVGSTREWRGPGHVRFRKANDPHWLELEKDENGKEIIVGVYFLWAKRKKNGDLFPYNLKAIRSQ